MGTSTGPRVALGQTPSDPASFDKGTTVTCLACKQALDAVAIRVSQILFDSGQP